MFIMSPTENEELMGKVEVSRLPNAPILAPFTRTWDVVAPGGASGEGASLLGFLSAISASTLKGRMATLGLTGSSVGLRLVCMSPLLTSTEREGSSSVTADIAIAGAIQVRLALLRSGDFRLDFCETTVKRVTQSYCATHLDDGILMFV